MDTDDAAGTDEPAGTTPPGKAPRAVCGTGSRSTGSSS